MTSWFLAYTKQKCEDNVSFRLAEAGFDILNPKVKERRLLKRKVSDVTSPLFPCYVFVKFDKMRDYHLIRYTRGIKWVLRNDAGPAEVDEKIVDSIICRMENGVITLKSILRPGDAVTIKGGPFEGFDAVFESEMNGAERVSILLKAINLRIIVDRGMVSSC